MVIREKLKGTRMTVDLGSERLCRAIRVLAAAQGRPLRDVVSEALLDWIEKQENMEDLAAIEEVRGEPKRPLRHILAELGESVNHTRLY